MKAENTGKYRVWNSVSGNMIYVPVNSPLEAINLIETLITFELADETIVFNAFGLEEYIEDEGGEWMEWESEGGDDIMAILDVLEGED